MKKTIVSLLMILFANLLTFAQPALAESDLYAKLGEKKGITKIVDDLLVILLADTRTERFFAKIDQPQFKAKLVDQLCEVSGGPCKYTGRSMKESHDGLEIKHGDFNALVEDLQKAMTKNKVSVLAQGQLLAKLAPMHRDVIEK